MASLFTKVYCDIESGLYWENEDLTHRVEKMLQRILIHKLRKKIAFSVCKIISEIQIAFKIDILEKSTKE